MTKLSKTLGITASVSTLALALSMSAAAAQDDSATDTDDTIVVTGFRSSLSAALDAKRDANGIVDAIVAEDIADFPDLNLAESLQRIPGVAIDRAAGEGRRITVRGLGGDFTRVRINGMEALSTFGGSDASGGSNRGRGFDFNTFASELFNELVVRKSQSASVEEGSLGANVELKTAQPFDFGPGFTGTVAGQLSYNDVSESVGPRFAGLLSYTDENETIGALVSVAYSDRDIREEGFSSVRFDDLGTFRSVDGVPCTTPLSTDCNNLRDSYYARIPRYGRLDYQQERLGITGSIQARPSDNTTISIDGLYSTLDGVRDEEFLEVFIRSNTDNVNVTDYAINSDGVLDFLQGDLLADVSNGLVPARSEHRRDELKNEFTQLTANIEHEFSDRLRGNIFAGTTKSDFDIPLQATIFFDAATEVNGYSYDFRNNLELPDISFGAFDVTDPASFLFTQFRNRPQSVENTFDTVQANMEYDFSEAITLSAGVSWKEFSFSTEEVRAEGNVADLAGFDAPIPVTDAIAGLVTGFGKGLDVGNIDSSWISANFDRAAGLVGLQSIEGVPRIQDTRGVVESDLGGYAQADFRFDWGGMPVRGDVGVRYVRTETSSRGFVGDQSVTITRDYDDWLPALNVVVEPMEDVLVRGGIARVMARPSLGNLTPGGTIDTFNGPPFTVSQGNPELDPFRATNFDLAAEWYFAEDSVIGIGLFYKDIESFFLQAETVETTFSQTGLPTSIASPTSPLAILLSEGQDPAVEINRQTNGGDASLRGLELVYQQPFTFLPGPLMNTGFVGNYTYVDSDEIIGFSQNSFNATFYYEDERFGARISGAYRDAYQTRRPNSSGRTEGREERGVAATFNLDFAASYELTQSIELTFEAVNLTDEFEHQTFDQLELPTLYHHTGRNFLAGARYTF